MKKSFYQILLGAVAAGSVLSAFAQQANVESQLVAHRIEVVNGVEAQKPADKASPGDVIEYNARYTNKGVGSANNLFASIPVPAGTQLIMDSGLPPGATGSIDGSRFAPLPLKRKVRTPDGKEHEELIPAAEYRALGWNLGALGAGKEVVVSLRVRVIPIDAPVAPKKG